MSHTPAAIILAAGKGTRMRSAHPKVMHAVAGFPMITHVIRAAMLAGCETVTPVIAPDMDDVKNAVTPHIPAYQAEQKGTGHAALCAKDALNGHDGPILILTGDAPLIAPDTLSALIDAAGRTGLAVMGFETDNPSGYGRLITDGDHVTAIVEDDDCTQAQRDITLCNSGAFCVDGKRLFDWLSRIGDDNAQGEIYLTDIVALAAADNTACALVIGDAEEAYGINSRAQLAVAETVMQNRLRRRVMDEGATLIAPETVFFSADTEIGRDVVIEPGVFFAPGVVVEDDVTIRAQTHIEASIIRKGAEIGPFARIRPQSDIGEDAVIGNFCEVNRTTLMPGAKCKHLSYLGDGVIEQKANIGAGTVIANYDGSNKHKTHIGAASFIGSNATLVAPLSIGDGAYVGAGSTITGDVPHDGLGVARAKQRIIENWASRRRQKK